MPNGFGSSLSRQTLAGPLVQRKRMIRRNVFPSPGDLSRTSQETFAGGLREPRPDLTPDLIARWRQAFQDIPNLLTAARGLASGGSIQAGGQGLGPVTIEQLRRAFPDLFPTTDGSREVRETLAGPLRPPDTQPPTQPPPTPPPIPPVTTPTGPGFTTPPAFFGEGSREQIRDLIFNSLFPDLPKFLGPRTKETLAENVILGLKNYLPIELSERLSQFLEQPGEFSRGLLPFSPQQEQLFDLGVNFLANAGPLPADEALGGLISRLTSPTRGGRTGDVASRFIEALGPGFLLQEGAGPLAFETPGFERTGGLQQRLARALFEERTPFGEGLTPEEVTAQTELLSIPLQRARELGVQDLKAEAARRGLTLEDAPLQERLARLDEELARQFGQLSREQTLADVGLRRAAAELNLGRQAQLADLIGARQAIDLSGRVAAGRTLADLLAQQQGIGLNTEQLLSSLLLGERGQERQSRLEAIGEILGGIGQERATQSDLVNALFGKTAGFIPTQQQAGIDLVKMILQTDLAERELGNIDAEAKGKLAAEIVAMLVGLFA